MNIISFYLQAALIIQHRFFVSYVPPAALYRPRMVRISTLLFRLFGIYIAA